MKNTQMATNETKTKIYLRKQVNSIEDLPENLRNIPKLIAQHTVPRYYSNCNVSESLFKFGNKQVVLDEDLELLKEIGYDIEIV